MSTFASKLASVTLALMGVRISPAQLNSLSTAAELGRVVLVFMKTALIFGVDRREVRSGSTGVERKLVT